jgi:hypothetical protein
MPTTHEQTMKALALANEVRSWGSRYLREIRTGVRSANNLICDPPPYGDKLRLERALRAQPYWGRARTEHFCERLRINPLKRLGDLSERERADLDDALRQWNGDHS